MSTLAKAIQKTTEEFLNSYVVACQAKNPRLLSTNLTKDCVRYIGPSTFLESVGAPPDFSMSNAEYEADFGQMEFYTFEAHEFYDLTVDVQNLKSAVRSVLTGKFNDGKDLSRQFVWFLDFNGDGSKIVRAYQHNDSEEGRNYRQMISEYHEAKNKTVSK